MRWFSPIPFKLIPTYYSESFHLHPHGSTGLPMHPHSGAFGLVRTNHVHEGVDLYCPDGTPVFAVEDGVVVSILPFTGQNAFAVNPKTGETEPLHWWLDTDVVMVAGATGVVAYGEIKPACKVGDVLEAGQVLGHVTRVLKKDKGRPMSMLHIELHVHGTVVPTCWYQENGKPESLMDPTPFLLQSTKEK
jgi:hypothetical protein